jgi:hypothetical protein
LVNLVSNCDTSSSPACKATSEEILMTGLIMCNSLGYVKWILYCIHIDQNQIHLTKVHAVITKYHKNLLSNSRDKICTRQYLHHPFILSKIAHISLNIHYIQKYYK